MDANGSMTGSCEHATNAVFHKNWNFLTSWAITISSTKSLLCEVSNVKTRFGSSFYKRLVFSSDFLKRLEHKIDTSCQHTTTWSRGLPEKLTGSQLLKKFPAFYGTRRYITTFTRARHLALS